jgi:NADPH:quinone reductase-like Zn-dependent oxidoreductase
MKVWEIGTITGIDGMRLAERADLVPGQGQVLVEVIAAGLNFRDLMVLEGRYGAPKPPERVPLADGVGRIAALGEGVSSWVVGERVIAPHFVNWTDGPYSLGVFAADLGSSADGWLAEQIVLPAEALVRVPVGMSDPGAATVSVVAATVWHALVEFGRVQPGELVLAQGTGGVSVFALQLAKALGAQVAITSSSDDKLARCRALGADYTVNYRDRPDWAAALLEATGGRGADVVVDTLGFDALGETVSACAVNARIGTVGALSGTPQAQAGVSQGLMIARNITLKGIASGSRAMLAATLEVLEKAGAEPVVDATFAFADAQDAYRHLAAGAHLGKVAITI